MKEDLRCVLRKLVSWVWVVVEERERVGKGRKGASTDKERGILGGGGGLSLETDDERSLGLGFESFLKLILDNKSLRREKVLWNVLAPE